ncbi:MAG TPA: hypothetical protein VEJ46_08465 [Candidatus Acidoferrum sp.]|nr:hypothetical protein [Candidatus Acidoferrum sp.]
MKHLLWRLSGCLGSALALAGLLCLRPVQAQQQPAPQAPTAAQPSPQNNPSNDSGNSSPAQTTPKNSASNAQSGTSNDRLFWTLPNFLTVSNEGKYPPLTAKQKFAVVLRSSFDYVEYPWYGLLAGIGQAENSEPSYGQGAEGYGKRYGTAMADGTIENFMTSAVVPSLLRQDPRYYQLGRGGFWHRTGYAVSRLFITRSDSGARQFNFSELCGSSAAAAISTYSYHPSADRNLSNAASVWGTQMGYDGLTFVVKEFWPDIKHKFSHKHPPE